MDKDNETKTNVTNQGVTLPDHDYEGIAEIVKNAKPTLPEIENGFMPLTPFNPNKSYEDWQRHIDEHVKWIRDNKLSPDQYAHELAKFYDIHRQLCEKHFQDRTSEWEQIYKTRIVELTNLHQEKERQTQDLHEAKANILKEKIQDSMERGDSADAGDMLEMAENIAKNEQQIEKLSRTVSRNIFKNRAVIKSAVASAIEKALTL